MVDPCVLGYGLSITPKLQIIKSIIFSAQANFISSTIKYACFHIVQTTTEIKMNSCTVLIILFFATEQTSPGIEQKLWNPKIAATC